MKLEGLDHPKTLDLVSRLGSTIPTVIGHLELFWAFVAKKCPQGNVGKFPDGAIAMACHWTGDATTFVTALADAGFLDRSKAHRFLVHDWQDHAPRWVLSKLTRAKQTIINSDCTNDSTDECSADYSRECSGDSVREAKGREGKPSQVSTSAAGRKNRNASMTAGDLVALGVEESLAKDWLTVRKTKRAPLTKTAWDAMEREALKAGITPQQAVRICAERGWQSFNSAWQWDSASSSGAVKPSKQSIEADRAVAILEGMKNGI